MHCPWCKASKRLAEVRKNIASRNAKRSELESFQKLLEGRGELLTELDEALRLGVFHQMRVNSGNDFIFVLKDGKERSRSPILFIRFIFRINSFDYLDAI